MVQRAVMNGTTPTDPNLKIAFVGDTADGNNWKAVLDLVKAEGAVAVETGGDMTYDADACRLVDGHREQGGHELSGVPGPRQPRRQRRGRASCPRRPTTWAAPPASTGPHNAAYKTVFRGLTLVTIKKGDTATTVNNLVGSDNHIWRVCNWHQNQNKMQVGGKGDEMGWAVYEACRQQGAIIITGHEHSYERTKTMTNMTNQTIDSSCSSGSSLCVGPGRTFVTVSRHRRHRAAQPGRCTPTSATRALSRR